MDFQSEQGPSSIASEVIEHVKQNDGKCGIGTLERTVIGKIGTTNALAVQQCIREIFASELVYLNGMYCHYRDKPK